MKTKIVEWSSRRSHGFQRGSPRPAVIQRAGREQRDQPGAVDQRRDARRARWGRARRARPKPRRRPRRRARAAARAGAGSPRRRRIAGLPSRPRLPALRFVEPIAPRGRRAVAGVDADEVGGERLEAAGQAVAQPREPDVGRLVGQVARAAAADRAAVDDGDRALTRSAPACACGRRRTPAAARAAAARAPPAPSRSAPARAPARRRRLPTSGRIQSANASSCASVGSGSKRSR